MRSSGVVSLLLLTTIVALGIATSLNWSIGKLPRFVVQDLHRKISLAAVLFLALHVMLAVIDSYVPITVIDALVPFLSNYHPIWLGLGTLVIDLMIVLIVTSLLRNRVGVRLWKLIHWLAYLCWPLAVVHSLLLGTDTGRTWMLGLYGLQGTVVVVLMIIRWKTNMDVTPQERFQRHALARKVSQ
jgi:DMSO/TMAO reductase YedYZ heme-binding membrane subunit